MAFACSKGYLKIVQLLLELKNIDINAKSILNLIFNILKQDYPNYSYKDYISQGTALVYAILNDHQNIVQLLLKQDSLDINAKCIQKLF